MAIPFDVDATWLNLTASYDAGELRRADGALMAGAAGQPWGGIARHSDTAMNVTVDGSDVVTVNPGAVVIPGNAVAETGVYRASLSLLQTGALAARHATNPRITLVIFRALDTSVVTGHGAYKGRIEFVDGTPGAVPSAPSIAGMQAVELARITVPQTGGGAASVDLTYRTFATAAGGRLAVPTSARLPAAAAKYQRAVALDTGVETRFDGAAWGAGGITHVADGDRLNAVSAAVSNPAGLKMITGKRLATFTAGVASITFPGGGFPTGVLAFNATTMTGANQNPVINAGTISLTGVTLAIPGLTGDVVFTYMAMGW